jgi:hypothetical protein
MKRASRPPLTLLVLGLSCATAAPAPDSPQTAGTETEETAARPGPPPANSRSRFDLPGECSAKMGVSHGIDDMAECEGPMGDTAAIELAVKALAADPDGIDARIQLASGPAALIDGTLHGSFSDGRPTENGDLTFGRFSVDFGGGLQVVGFVLRERNAGESIWIFHILGGSGCLSNARGELSLPERTRGTLKLAAGTVTACTQDPQAPASTIPGLDLPALLRLIGKDGGSH